MRILIAGVGNVLRGDDAFGVVIARKLAARDLPAGVQVVETGIAGIALVSELQEGWDALVVADAVDRDRPPGTVMVIEAQVDDVNALSWSARHDFLADMHLATPERALMLARALGVLPPSVTIVGCQPEDMEELDQGLSAPVAGAIEPALAAIMDHVHALLASWKEPAASPASVSGAAPDPVAPLVGGAPEADTARAGGPRAVGLGMGLAGALAAAGLDVGLAGEGGEEAPVGGRGGGLDAASTRAGGPGSGTTPTGGTESPERVTVVPGGQR